MDWSGDLLMKKEIVNQCIESLLYEDRSKVHSTEIRLCFKSKKLEVIINKELQHLIDKENGRMDAIKIIYDSFLKFEFQNHDTIEVLKWLSDPINFDSNRNDKYHIPKKQFLRYVICKLQKLRSNNFYYYDLKER